MTKLNKLPERGRGEKNKKKTVTSDQAHLEEELSACRDRVHTKQNLSASLSLHLNISAVEKFINMNI